MKFLLAGLIVLSACGPVTYTQRFALAPAKPDKCAITMLKKAAPAEGYEVLGTVSLVLRKYQTASQSEVSLDEKNLSTVSTEACKLGGDAIAFGHSTPSSADFVVFRKLESNAEQSGPGATSL